MHELIAISTWWEYKNLQADEYILNTCPVPMLKDNKQHHYKMNVGPQSKMVHDSHVRILITHCDIYFICVLRMYSIIKTLVEISPVTRLAYMENSSLWISIQYELSYFYSMLEVYRTQRVVSNVPINVTTLHFVLRLFLIRLFVRVV